jgi:hypothetical protein
LDANGVSTETATTNLHPSPLDLTAAPWRTFPDAIESKGIIREFYDNNKIVRITRPDLASSCTEILSDNTMPISVSTIYTQSLDVRTDGTIKTITFYTNNGHHTVAPSVVDLEQGWKRLTASYTSQSTDTFLRICDIYVNNDWTFIEMKRPQIEQRPYASAFTAVSRGDGNVDITIPTINSTSQSFTVNFNVAFNGVNPASRDTCLELNNFLLLWLFAPTSTDTYNRRLIMDFKTLDGGGTGVPGYTGSARVSKDLQDTNPFVPWKYETITLTWDGSTIRAYRNGILWGGRGKDSTCVLGTIDKLMFRKFGQIKNLSVHNRVLTDADIYKLSNYKFGVSKFGDIHVVSSERPNSIPSGCYYFPLGLNAKNEFNNIGPYAEVNTVYEDGSVWVGSATTNLLDGTMSINNNFSIVIEDGWNKLTLNSGDGSMGNRFFVPVSSLTNGAIYTASCEVYNPNAEAITAHIDWCDQNNINTLIPPFTLKRIYVTASRSAYDATYRFMDVAITDVGKTIWIRKPMVQRTSFLTPYTPLSKDTSQLTFNLNSKIGLDWSGDWSIVYFKKPVGTSIDLTGYSLESLGCNTNSVGGSYLWWGKGGSTNTLKGNSEGGVPIPTFDNNVINPSTFFNNWYMVSVVKSGTTITIKYFGVDKSVRTATLSGVSYTAANAFVNQYGYDFNLGGWDNNTNGYVSNAYYRDLIVAKRALSAAEVEAIFKTFMKAKQTGLQIQGRLKENVVL